MQSVLWLIKPFYFLVFYDELKNNFEKFRKREKEKKKFFFLGRYLNQTKSQFELKKKKNFILKFTYISDNQSSKNVLSISRYSIKLV